MVSELEAKPGIPSERARARPRNHAPDGSAVMHACLGKLGALRGQMALGTMRSRGAPGMKSSDRPSRKSSNAVRAMPSTQ
jgi:hypothetical protein